MNIPTGIRYEVIHVGPSKEQMIDTLTDLDAKLFNLNLEQLREGKIDAPFFVASSLNILRGAAKLEEDLPGYLAALVRKIQPLP